MGEGKLLSPAERAVHAPKERLKPSVWTERNRIIALGREPGPYRFDRTPYWREVVDLIEDPFVQEILVIAGVQVGKTTTQENMLAYLVDSAPGPAMYVVPRLQDIDKLVKENVKALNTHTLASHHPKMTKRACEYDTMPLYFANSGSVAALASRPVRYLFLDEVNKFKRSKSSVIDQSRGRLTTYTHASKLVMVSSPTEKDTEFYKEYEATLDKRTYHVPCPHCGEYQQLTWGGVTFKEHLPEGITDHKVQAQYLLANQCATYRCFACNGEWSNGQKNAAIAKGLWLSEGQKVVNGQVQGERPTSKRVAFHISTLYSPWKTLSDVAAVFLQAIGDPTKMMTFRNDYLGEFYEQIAERLDSKDLKEAAKTAPKPFVCPWWTAYLVATADFHGLGKGVYYVIRAWGAGERSQLIAAGNVDSLDELKRICLDQSFEVEGKPERAWVEALYIDAGYRTDEVYSFAATNPDRIRPVKGASTPTYLISRTALKEYPGVTLRLIDTAFFKSKLAALRREGVEKWGICQMPADTLAEYLRHLASEHQIVANNGKLIWQTISKGLPNHFLDCEVYSVAAAVVDLHIDQLPPPTPPEQQESKPTPSQPVPVVIPKPSGWVTGFRRY